MTEQELHEWINAQAGKWCSWQSTVHTRGGGKSYTYERPVYGIILPDWETARDEGKFSVLDIQPDDVTYDCYVDPEEITILDDVPRVFPAGYSSLAHPNEQEEA